MRYSASRHWRPRSLAREGRERDWLRDPLEHRQGHRFAADQDRPRDSLGPGLAADHGHYVYEQSGRRRRRFRGRRAAGRGGQARRHQDRNIITGLGRVRTGSLAELENVLIAYRPGEMASVHVLRDGRREVFPVRLGSLGNYPGLLVIGWLPRSLDCPDDFQYRQAGLHPGGPLTCSPRRYPPRSPPRLAASGRRDRRDRDRPALADTAAFCERYGVTGDESADCVVRHGRAGGRDPVRRLRVLATTRADVNGSAARHWTYARHLRRDGHRGRGNGDGVRRDHPGRPARHWPILVDAAAAATPQVVIGSGLGDRSSRWPARRWRPARRGRWLGPGRSTRAWLARAATGDVAVQVARIADEGDASISVCAMIIGVARRQRGTAGRRSRPSPRFPGNRPGPGTGDMNPVAAALQAIALAG